MKRTLALWMGGLALLACAITTESDRIEKALPTLSAEELLQAGEARMEKGEFVHARQYFKFLSENFPNSPQAVRALLKSAEAHELQGGRDNLGEAKIRYADFYNRFPQAPEAEEALFKQGTISLALKEKPSREPLNIRGALLTFQRYLQIFPDGKHVEEVRQGILACNDALAEHELEVARFYYKRKAYRAALGRLAFLERGFPEYRRLDAVYQLYAQIHLATGEASLAEEYSQKAAAMGANPTNP